MTNSTNLCKDKTNCPMLNTNTLSNEIKLNILKAKITEEIKLQHWYNDVISGNIMRER